MEKAHNSHASSSGSAQFIQLCHQWFYQDTSSRWQTRTHRPVCLCRPGLCFFTSPGCDAEWEEACWSLTVLMPHSQGFPGRSDTHKQAHSIPEDMLDRHDHRLPGNNRPVVIVPLVMFHHMILWSFSSANKQTLKQVSTVINNTACYAVVLNSALVMPSLDNEVMCVCFASHLI